MKALIIAEKPSVSMAIAKALSVNGARKDGYIEGDRFVVTWCVGHLVTMAYPESYDEKYKEWNLNELPFLPEKDSYVYQPNDATKKQLSVVTKLYHRSDIDKLYIFPDPAQEGFYLQALVLEYAKISPSIQIYCALCDSQTDEEIVRAFNEAIPWTDAKITNMVKAGYMRAKEDYLIGINYSRALTKKYEDYLNEVLTDGRKTVAVGRVMTCVLSMVVKREREIAAFVPENYYRIDLMNGKVIASWKETEDSSLHNSFYVYEGKGIKEKEQADKFIKSLPEKVKVIKKEIKTEKKTAPLLFSLTELQAYCAKEFKYNPQKVLTIAQNLYEKKLTTYPRTDSKYLTNAIAKEIGINLRGLTGIPKYKEPAELILKEGKYKTLSSTRYVDDLKVEDHYAIIPTGKGLENLSSLKEEELKVFYVIVNRFLSIFYPPAEYGKAELEFLAGKEHFFASKKILTKEGYLEMAGYVPDKEDTKEIFEEMKRYKEGEMVSAIYLTSDIETSPPKRYTSSSLLLAMDNAGQFVEDESLREVLKESKGIGTTATRAGIIDKLVHTNHYLALNEKTQVYTPQFKGEIVYDILDATIPNLLNPAFSASWTKGLKQIEKGEITDSVYYQKLAVDVKSYTEKIKTEDKTIQLKKAFNQMTPRYKKEAKEGLQLQGCPVCGKPMKKAKNGICCSDYGKEEDKCKFYLPYNIKGKTLSITQLNRLIKDRKLDTISGFKKKDGSGTFAAPLYIHPGGIVKMTPPEGSSLDIECPKCGSALQEETFSMKCPKCDFSIPRSIAGRKLSLDNIRKLTRGEETEFLTGFKKKDGSGTFPAKLILRDGKVDFIMRQGTVKDAYCPVCKKEMVYTPFGMSCSNYKKGCNFAVGTICEKTLSDAQILTLLREKETGEIKGFKKKSGEEFSTALYITKEGEIKFGHPPKKMNMLCPLCQKGHLEDLGKFAQCSECHSRAPSVYCEKRLTKEEIANLMIYGRTGKISGFVKKNGEKFSAVLIRDKDGKFRFE